MLRILREEGRSVRAIVTDLNMPAMGGLELIRQVRADQNTAGPIPIIVISGDTGPQGARAQVPWASGPTQDSQSRTRAEVRQKLEQLLDAKPTSGA